MFGKIMLISKSKYLLPQKRLLRTLLLPEDDISRRASEIIDACSHNRSKALHNLIQHMDNTSNSHNGIEGSRMANSNRKIYSRMIIQFQGKQPTVIQTTKSSIYIFYDRNATDFLITAPTFTIVEECDSPKNSKLPHINTPSPPNAIQEGARAIEHPPNLVPNNANIVPNQARNVRNNQPLFQNNPPPTSRARRFLAPEGLRDIRCYLTTGTLNRNQRQRVAAAAPSTESPPVPSEAVQKNESPTTIPENEASQTQMAAFGDYIKKHPKGTLHNMFSMVAQQLNNNDLRVQAVFSKIKDRNNSIWCCTYNLKWPEPMKFVATNATKQDASHQAALQALSWLKKQGKIDYNGQPIIIDHAEIQQMTKRTMPKLDINFETLENMRRIIRLHTDEFIPTVTNNNKGESQTLKPTLNEVKELGLFGRSKPKFLGPNKYFAKEKVNLPIAAYKDQFINLLRKSQVVIVKGEPGCGKSTRIPQYVLESWITSENFDSQHCRIAVTQPRRIAAISLAERVASERSESAGQIVGYQVRLKHQFNPQTGRILYCTTGILLRHLQSDPTLSNFSHIILDEAHERDVNTDLLMNLLRHTLSSNSKLKVIVMSATIDTDMFRNYFDGAPLIHIPGFTHPVKSYFLDDLKDLDVSTTIKNCENDLPAVVHEDVVKIIRHIHKTKGEGAILCFLPGWDDITRIERMIPKQQDLAVFCLHSRMQDAEQWRIFCKPPPGCRKIILATNIAETSVTIDDVAFVIDSGIHKENRFDNDKGITCIDNHWISQASSIQRKGRAGRCQPGDCYHVYTKSKFDSFHKYTDPEILKTSLTKIVLDAKAYSNDMEALEFMSKLPSPPEKTATRRAVRELKDLQLLDDDEKMTPLGRTLANFQLEPKLAKAMVNAVVYKCVTPIVDIITLFSADTEIFQSGLVDKEKIKYIKSRGCRNSDHLAMMRLFEAWLQFKDEDGEIAAKDYCGDAGLVHPKMITIEKLRKIHFDYLFNGLHDSFPIGDDYSDNDELVKAILFSGVGTLLKYRNWDVVKGRYKKSNIFLTNYNQKATIASESVNFKRTSFASHLLVYINEVRSNIRRTTVVRETSEISPLAVLLFSNKDIIITESATADADNVIISLKDTKVEYTCRKEVAEAIKNCNAALDASYEYFISQITEGGESNESLYAVWDKILQNLNIMLRRISV